MIRVVVTGGGTGGHLYPALAVAEALKQDSEIEAILYIGNTHRKEAQLVPPAGIAFQGLIFSGMPRTLSPALFKWGLGLFQSFLQAQRYLKDFRPDVVFATGGYVTAPVLMAALSLNIPYVIHEPDAFPGLVNRQMSRWAEVATCAFADAQKRLKAKTLSVTGNPLRSQIGQVTKAQALERLHLGFDLEKPTLLVTGGSQGARRINQGVLDALPQLIEDLGFQVIHQTGEALFEETRSQCPEAYRQHAAYWMAPFFEDMASVLALADIAVCRSGSMTLSEMYRAHIPMVLVPYPYAAADHQRQNALASQRAGASLMVEDHEFTGNKLVEILTALTHDNGALLRMRQQAEALSAPDATASVVKIIQSVGMRNSS